MKSAGETKTEKEVAQTRRSPGQLCIDFTLKKRPFKIKTAVFQVFPQRVDTC